MEKEREKERETSPQIGGQEILLRTAEMNFATN